MKKCQPVFEAPPLQHAWVQTLSDSLNRLDTLIAYAIRSLQSGNNRQAPPENPYRGVYISTSEVMALLNQSSLTPFLHTPPTVSNTKGFQWLQDTFGLSAFEIDLIILTLAPELDGRYERIFVYIQDDITRRLPTVDLALKLLAPSPEAAFVLRRSFMPEAPLLRYGLINLTPEDKNTPTPLIHHSISLNPRFLSALIGYNRLPGHLSPRCELIESQYGLEDLDDTLQYRLANLLEMSYPARDFRVVFDGNNEDAKRQAAEALATAVRRRLLMVNIQDVEPPSWPALASELALEARLQSAVLYLSGNALPYVDALDDLPLIVTDPAWRGDAFAQVAFSAPSYVQQREAWCAALNNIAHHPQDIDLMAARFRLNKRQIAAAIQTARANHPADEHLSLSTLKTAARTQTHIDLGNLARRLTPFHEWDELILEGDVKKQLYEICERVNHHHRVIDEWGFQRRLALGLGVNILFTGPPGTGKTMSAEVIANSLGLALYKIDLSGVISKYIGETEKNLNHIFDAAQGTNVILLFDEADALFGKRSEVRDSHDRYANMEISFLLQRMEEYDGIAILATNLRNNLDKAFLRRMAFVVNFTIPEPPERLQIWQRMFPPEMPTSSDIDVDFLSQQFKLAGGNIKNIVVAAAFLAATDQQSVGMRHIIAGIRREYQKLGRVCSRTEFGEYFDLLEIDTR